MTRMNRTDIMRAPRNASARVLVAPTQSALHLAAVSIQTNQV